MIFNLNSQVRIETIRCFLRYPKKSDYAEWRKLRELSSDFLIPWEPLWPINVHEKKSFVNWLKFVEIQHRSVRGQYFFILAKDDNKLLGGINLLDIFYGIKMYARIGYWIGKPYANFGYMTEALIALCDYSFKEIRLNRLESVCLPNNIPSNKVLLKAGFEREGLLRNLYCINGKFEDHYIYSKINPLSQNRR